MISHVREEVSKEIKRRVHEGMGRPKMYEGDGGVWGIWGRILPAIHIYEGATEHKLIKPGLYDIILPVQIEYISRLSDITKVYEEGREKLEQLQAALELDERLRKNGDEEELVIAYSIETTEIADVLSSVLAVAMLYNFRYTDKFLGYEPARH